MKIIIETKFNVGDTVYAPVCYYELYARRNAYKVKNILIDVRYNKANIKYEIERDGDVEVVPEYWVFATFAECEEWCYKHA